MKAVPCLIVALISLFSMPLAFAGAGLLPVGVCDLPEPAAHVSRTCSYPGYVHEILQHAGFGYSRVALDKLTESLPSLRILVTAGSVDLPAETLTALAGWISQGGVWVSIGSVGGVPDWFGVALERPVNNIWYSDTRVPLGEGYLTPNPDSGALAPMAPLPLHFFNGLAVRATSGRVLAGVVDAHQRPSSRAGMVECPRGKGRCILIAPDLTGTVVRIQQGVPIAFDGVPFSDGVASIAEHVLKTEDGKALDWTFDRQYVPGAGELQAYTQPIADLWREVLLRTVLQVAKEGRIALPVLWFYPRNLPALAHLSHDTDGNDAAGAQLMLAELEKAKIHSSWCILLPGYPKEVIQKIAQSGHELATHFDAMTKTSDWCAEGFATQVASLTALFDGAKPVTNKNHILRWEGYTEFYGWCDAQGIEIEQSKGDCQSGVAGFPFGSCHPYTVVSTEGKPYNVLELPTLTQDIIMTQPPAVADMIMDGVQRHYGVAHFLFHPAHTNIPAVKDAMQSVLAQGKARGMEWWLARDISTWERARRTATWSDFAAEESSGHGKAQVAFRTERPLADATILWLSPEKVKTRMDGKRQSTQSVERWGFTFESATADLLPGKAHELAVAW